MQIQGVCRNIHHVSIHNPTAEKTYCNNCESSVFRITGNICPCCNSPVKRKKTYRLCRTVLNKVVSSYGSLIESFILHPISEPVVLYCKHRFITYAIPISVAALYYDTIESKKLPAWTRKVWGKKDHTELQKTEIIKFCDKRIKGVGLG